MNDIYKKAYIELFLLHDVRTIPEQIFIDENEEVALHIWNNIPDNSSYHDSYEYINLNKQENYLKYKISEIYKNYKDNISFWEKLLTTSSNYKVLFLQEFRNDFSDVYESIISNKELLKKQYQIFKDNDILNLNQELLDDKENLHKSAILSSSYINSSDIENYYNDVPFILDVFKNEANKHGRGVFLYKDLPQNLKDNKEIIQTILSNEPHNWAFFSLISKDLQEEFLHSVKTWSSPSLKDFCNLDIETQKKLLHKAIQHLPQLIQRKPTVYWSKAVSLLEEDLSYITFFRDSDIEKISKSISINNKLYNNLKTYVEDYKSSNNYRKHQMLTTLIKSQPELFAILEDNIHHKISNLVSNKHKIEKKEFYSYFNILYDKFINNLLTYENCTELVNILVGAFTIETAKELRLPKKNAFTILKTEKEHEHLQEYLNSNTNNKNTTTKIKI